MSNEWEGEKVEDSFCFSEEDDIPSPFLPRVVAVDVRCDVSKHEDFIVLSNTELDKCDLFPLVNHVKSTTVVTLPLVPGHSRSKVDSRVRKK